MTNNLAVSLLTHYSFDLGGYNASELVKRWENQYPSNWVHLAIIEALYQGRYKAVSAQQILTLWLKRNHPSYHFNMEFERLICNKLPEDLRWNNSLPPLPPALPSVSGNPTIQDVMSNYESQTYVEEDDYYTELENNQVDENSKVREASKLLPSSSSMVFISSSESSTSTTSNFPSRTLTETRSHVVRDSELRESQQIEQPQQIEKIEKPFASDKIVKFLPPERNHPPIEQFTPEKNDSSDTFTSKLKGVMG
ncbi:MAG: hypothetical protein SWZ49_27685 [Cyanobacteriota bacterium]|nr:hypothetical protein [Cyanobacteriota bacterium]